MSSKRGIKIVAKWTAAALGGLLIAGGLLAPREAEAQTMSNVMIAGPGGASLLARVYRPANQVSGMPAAVLLHGCSGVWSKSVAPTFSCTGSSCTVDQAINAQSHIEKWGRHLAAQGYYALAVDSFSNRGAGTQKQCGGGTVDPYTTRADDFYAGKDHLLATYDVAPGGVAVIGWSQGAETALIVSAETPNDEDTTYCSLGVADCAAREADRPAAAVTFYPGCGSLLGFGYHIGNGTAASPQDPGYFRPDVPLRWNHGEADTTVAFGPCLARMNEANTPTYASGVEIDTYAGVNHSFDMNTGTTNAQLWAWPAAKCSAAELLDPTKVELCAREDADIDSMAFILANVAGE